MFVSSIGLLCWELIWQARITELHECSCATYVDDWLANSSDNWVDTCLSLLSGTFDDDVWDFDVDPLENFSKRRRRSWKKINKEKDIFRFNSILHQAIMLSVQQEPADSIHLLDHSWSIIEFIRKTNSKSTKNPNANICHEFSHMLEHNSHQKKIFLDKNKLVWIDNWFLVRENNHAEEPNKQLLPISCCSGSIYGSHL